MNDRLDGWFFPPCGGRVGLGLETKELIKRQS
jgi:hypothetical protein